jgi:succinyl-diaminopimelate desuccinylase
MSNLLAATRDLMAVPSPSRGEAALAGVVEDALRACPWLDTERIGDNVIGRTSLDHGQRLVLAGHLDTVPANGNEEPRLEGDTLWGLGASDMKGGLAVMLDLARRLAALTAASSSSGRNVRTSWRATLPSSGNRRARWSRRAARAPCRCA